jgi:ATP-binding cassette, subfamily B, bacterial
MSGRGPGRHRFNLLADEDTANVGAHHGAAHSAGFLVMLRSMPGYARLLLTLSWQASRWTTFATCFFQIAVAAGSAFGLVAVAKVTASLLNAKITLAALQADLPSIALVVAVYAALGGLQVAAVAATAQLKPVVTRLVEMRLVAAASHVDLEAYDDSRFHDLLLRARDTSVPFFSQCLDGMVQFVGSVFSVLAITGTLAVLSPVLFPVLALSVLPQAWAAAQGARNSYSVALATFPAQRRLQFTLNLVIDASTAAEVRALTAQSFLLGMCQRLSLQLEQIQARLALRNAGYDLLGRTLSGVGTAVAYLLLIYLVATNATSVGSAGAAVVAIQVGRTALGSLARSLSRLYEHSLYVHDYMEFLADAAARTRTTTGVSAPDQPETIEVDNVTFSYPGQDGAAVRGVTLTLRRGEVLALVGENGSGKTTLSMLIAGLYTPTGGAIRWDGIDLAAVDPSSVHRQVAVVMQTPVRWPLTLRENITIGRPERPDPGYRAVADAALMSGADGLAAELPRKWETLLSKRFKHGHELSGGQWQRVAVARAVYRDAPLLICDEPTAAVDARAEAAIFAALRRLAQGRTVVLVTHRMVSTRDADRIAVLHKGELAELGTHEELMALGGQYAEMYDLQADAYRVTA